MKDFIFHGDIKVPVDLVHDIIKIGAELGIEGLEEQLRYSEHDLKDICLKFLDIQSTYGKLFRRGCHE